MLRHAWYLITDDDYWAGSDGHPRGPEADELAAALAELFGDDAGYSPEQTTAATEGMLHLAEHLSQAIAEAGVTIPDRARLARLLHGLNLLTAYLAQVSGLLADQVRTGIGADLSTLNPHKRQATVTALAAACGLLEQAAAQYGQAHLSTRTPPERQPPHGIAASPGSPAT